MKTRRYVAMAGVAVLGVLAWLLWPPTSMPTHDEAGSNRQQEEREVPNVESPRLAEARRPTRFPEDRTKPHALRVNDSRPQVGEAAVYARCREGVRKDWDEFVRLANPTEDQQQSLLSAIYDAGLDLAELDRVQNLALDEKLDHKRRVDEAESFFRATGRTTRVSEEGAPFTLEDFKLWRRDVAEGLTRRAGEVLSKTQFSIYADRFNVTDLLAADCRFVIPSDR